VSVTAGPCVHGAVLVPEMISFFLRSRYGFIFKEQTHSFICGYVPLCTERRVLLRAHVFGVSCTRFALCVRTAFISNETFLLSTETFDVVMSLVM
jgi:hypothetical protein